VSASSPSGDPGTRASLLRNGGAAAGLVAVVALAFWGIGSFQDDGTPVAVDEPAADPAEDEQAEPEPEPEPEEEPEPEPEPEPEEEPDPEPEEEDEPEPEPEEDADPDDDAEDDEP
jgi:outer membrane biosynthesis protein TonB